MNCGRRGRRRALACLCALALSSTGCISERSPTAAAESAECVLPLAALRRGAVPVLIRDLAFVPDTLRIAAGSTVVWVNCEDDDAHAHTATASNSAWGSPVLDRGAAWEHTFTVPGEYDYVCLPHSFMRGVVRVE
jgi:plastocyanin